MSTNGTTQMTTRVAVTFTGQQGADISARALGALAAKDCTVEDVSLSQSIRADVQLAITFITSKDPQPIIDQLKEHARETDFIMRYELDEPRRDSIGPTTHNKFSATLLNENGLSASLLHKWLALLEALEIQIDRVERLNEGNIRVADFRLSVPTTVDLAEFRAQTFQLSVDQNTDIAILPHNVYRKNKRLVVFDMDSTLIQQEVIDELAKHAGVVDKVAVGFGPKVSFSFSFKLLTTHFISLARLIRQLRKPP